MDRLSAELEQASAELAAHLASWGYAFAMGSGCHGGQNHPAHRATRERTVCLRARCDELRARLERRDR
ncbi:MAG TPA: hypothetical protein VHR88_09645 [Solirubrobacteraceae bacterium]|nr:hypothetical protein [Solirubrobacteraceae bacterium]